jgi:hypothetical protein
VGGLVCRVATLGDLSPAGTSEMVGASERAGILEVARGVLKKKRKGRTDELTFVLLNGLPKKKSIQEIEKASLEKSYDRERERERERQLMRDMTKQKTQVSHRGAKGLAGRRLSVGCRLYTVYRGLWIACLAS